MTLRTFDVALAMRTGLLKACDAEQKIVERLGHDQAGTMTFMVPAAAICSPRAALRRASAASGWRS
jgi:hypothetical protein